MWQMVKPKIQVILNAEALTMHEAVLIIQIVDCISL